MGFPKGRHWGGQAAERGGIATQWGDLEVSGQEGRGDGSKYMS